MKHFLIASIALVWAASGLLAQDGGSGIPADTEIKTTPSGLKYCVLKEGTGDERPNLGDTVTVNYTGWLSSNEKKFDSSRDRGTPASFMLGQVIPGWNEGLALMNKGAHYKLIIPASLGYGERGAGDRIPPGSELIFEVELLSWVKGEPIPALPVFDEAKAKTTESGLKIQNLVAGEGAAAGEKDLVVWHYAIWLAKEKQLVDCSEFRKGARKIATSVSAEHPFLKELCKGAKPGMQCFVDVPPAQLISPQLARDPSQVPETLFLITCEKVIPFARAENAAVQKTESGIEIETVVEGKGAQPGPTSTVTCQYAGWLTDGSPFDSSYKTGNPASFPLNGVIKGWTEGLKTMKAGGIARLTIPAALAYGEAARPGIPANSTLIFWIELLEVK